MKASPHLSLVIAILLTLSLEKSFSMEWPWAKKQEQSDRVSAQNAQERSRRSRFSLDASADNSSSVARKNLGAEYGPVEGSDYKTEFDDEKGSISEEEESESSQESDFFQAYDERIAAMEEKVKALKILFIETGRITEESKSKSYAMGISLLEKMIKQQKEELASARKNRGVGESPSIEKFFERFLRDERVINEYCETAQQDARTLHNMEQMSTYSALIQRRVEFVSERKLGAVKK